MAMTGPTPGTLGLRYLPSRGLRDRLVAGPDAGHGVDADKYHSQGKMMQRMSFSPPPPVRPSCIDVDATSPAGQRESKGKGKALQRMSHSPSPPIRPSCIDFSGCSPGPCGPSAQSPGECAGLGMADEVGSRPYDHGKSSWGALEISASPPPRRCAARPGQDGSPRSPSSSPPARTSDSSLHEDNERAILCSPSNNRPRYFDEQVAAGFYEPGAADRKMGVRLVRHLEEMTVWAHGMRTWASKTEEEANGVKSWAREIETRQAEGSMQVSMLREWAEGEARARKEQETSTEFLTQWAKAVDSWAKDAEMRLRRAEEVQQQQCVLSAGAAGKDAPSHEKHVQLHHPSSQQHPVLGPSDDADCHSRREDQQGYAEAAQAQHLGEDLRSPSNHIGTKDGNNDDQGAVSAGCLAFLSPSASGVRQKWRWMPSWKKQAAPLHALGADDGGSAALSREWNEGDMERVQHLDGGACDDGAAAAGVFPQQPAGAGGASRQLDESSFVPPTPPLPQEDGWLCELDAVKTQLEKAVQLRGASERRLEEILEAKSASDAEVGSLKGELASCQVQLEEALRSAKWSEREAEEEREKCTRLEAVVEEALVAVQEKDAELERMRREIAAAEARGREAEERGYHRAKAESEKQIDSLRAANRIISGGSVSAPSPPSLSNMESTPVRHAGEHTIDRRPGQRGQAISDDGVKHTPRRTVRSRDPLFAGFCSSDEEGTIFDMQRKPMMDAGTGKGQRSNSLRGGGVQLQEGQQKWVF